MLVLADALDRVIGDEHSAEMASFSRASIADHEQDQRIDAADHLIDGLRDGTLAYLRRTGDPAVLTVLLRRRPALYARIVYYVTSAALSQTDASAADPATVSSSSALRGYARTLVMDKAAFADSRTRLEFGALAGTMLAHLTPDDIAQLAHWLKQGPQMPDTEISQMLGSPGTPAAAERVAEFKDHWRADRIAVLGPDLPEPLRDIATDLAARGVSPPENPGFSHWMSMDAGIASPVSAQELASMSVTDVTELVRTYSPPAHMVFRFPEYALVQQVTEDIAARPTDYSRHAAGFTDLRPGYVNAFMNGLRQAIGAHGRSNSPDGAAPALDLAWEPVLNLVASIAEKLDPGGRNAEQREDSPRSLHRGVAMLLKTALAIPDSGLSAEHADTILVILRALLNSPDPVPDDEAGDDALDPADRALNSVRGQAVAAWWPSRAGGSGSAEPRTTRRQCSWSCCRVSLTPAGKHRPRSERCMASSSRSFTPAFPAGPASILKRCWRSPAAESEIGQRDTAELPEQTPAEQVPRSGRLRRLPTG